MNATRSLYQPRSVPQILKEATVLYWTQGWAMNRAILLPVLLIYAGLYSTLIAFSYLYQNDVIAILLGIPFLPVLLPLVSLLLFAATMSLFFIGFWQYVVYFAAFCRSTAALLDDRPLDCRADYQFVLGRKKPLLALLNGLILVQILALGVGLIISLPCLFLPDPWADVISNLLFSGLLLAAYTWFSFGFQIIGLDSTTHPGWMGTMQQSARLIREHYWRCFSLLMIFAVLTCGVLPWLCLTLLAQTPVMGLLNDFHLGMITVYYDQLTAIPLIKGLVSFLGVSPRHLAAEASQALIGGVVSSLPLGWGSIAFTMLYGDVMGKAGEAPVRGEGRL